MKILNEYKVGEIVECKVYNARTNSHEFREGVVTNVRTIFNDKNGKEYPILFAKTIGTYWKGDSFGHGEFYDKPTTIGYIYNDEVRIK